MREIAVILIYLSSLSDYLSTMFCVNGIEANPLMALLMDHGLFVLGKMGVTVLMCYFIYHNFNAWKKGYTILTVVIVCYYTILTINNLSIAL